MIDFKRIQEGTGEKIMAAVRASKITIVILTVVALALVGSTLAAINVSQNVTSNGSISTSPNIGVFSDSGCSANMTSVNWGSVAAGSSVTRTFYVKNTGTGSLSLSLAANSWIPSGAGNYITVSWNQQGATLDAGQSVGAIVTLTVTSGITGITSFSNSIVISGSG
jgi:hypothetical protein